MAIEGPERLAGLLAETRFVEALLSLLEDVRDERLDTSHPFDEVTTGLELCDRLAVDLLDTLGLGFAFGVFLLESIDGFEQRAGLDDDREVFCQGDSH